MKKIILILTALLGIIITSVAQVKLFDTKVSEEERTLKIKSNISDVRVKFANAGKNYKQELGIIKNGILSYVFQSIAGKQTTLELYGDHVLTKTIKLSRYLKNFTNPFSSQSYALSPNSKTITIDMDYKDSYMETKFKEIENSQDPKVFEVYNSAYPKSKLKQIAINKIDSLELNIAVNKRSEKAMDEFISSHKSSKFLQEAEKIKKDYANARIAFENAKQNNSSESMAKFINDYPKSLEYNEANKIYVERAFSETLNKNNIKDALDFTDNVLYPKKQYIDVNKFEEFKRQITENVDQLIVASAEKDKSYEVLKNYWVQYQDLQPRYQDKLGMFMKCFSFKNQIYTTLYKNLVNFKSEADQTAFLTKSKEDFKGLNKCDGSNANEDIIGCIVANSEKPDGAIKLYNQQFLKKRYTWEGDLYYLLFYNDKDVSDWDVDYEELTFKDNKQVKLVASKLKKPVLKVTFENCVFARGCAYEASFYSNGNLVRTQVSDKNEKMYYYDFENGVNVSLKNLDNKINEADRALASNDFDKALNILNNDCKNNYPGSVAQNQRLQNSIIKAKQVREVYLKKQEEIRLAEERKREKIRQEQEAIRLEQENPISNHHSYIKNRLYEYISVKMILKNEQEANKVLEKMIENLEKYDIKRKMTKRDEIYLEKVMQEIGAEQGFLADTNKKMQNSSRVEKCIWCGNKYNSVEGWDISDDNNCKLIEQKYVELTYGNMGNMYCSQKCAKCSCLSKKGINCRD
jgi:hypothetical protein